MAHYVHGMLYVVASMERVGPPYDELYSVCLMFPVLFYIFWVWPSEDFLKIILKTCCYDYGVLGVVASMGLVGPP